MTAKPIKPSFTNPAPAMYCLLYGALKEKALELGYALAVHGSLQRDFDLLAVPWIEEAVDAATLVEALRTVCGGFIIADGTAGARWDAEQFKLVAAEIKNPQSMPHGRLAWNIHFAGSVMLDVSVMPRSPSKANKPPLPPPSDWPGRMDWNPLR